MSFRRIKVEVLKLDFKLNYTTPILKQKRQNLFKTAPANNNACNKLPLLPNNSYTEQQLSNKASGNYTEVRLNAETDVPLSGHTYQTCELQLFQSSIRKTS